MDPWDRIPRRHPGHHRQHQRMLVRTVVHQDAQMDVVFVRLLVGSFWILLAILFVIVVVLIHELTN